jgi:hypothetical protein
MKDDMRDIQRLLEQATDAGATPPDELDPEAASLREAWLAFGQMLEGAQPPEDTPIHAPLPVEEKPRIRTNSAPSLWHWYVRAASLLAVSLLIAVATAGMLRYSHRQAGSEASTEKTASTDHKTIPSRQSRGQRLAKADDPQWDDSLDEQFAQVSWKMACIQQNQLFRTDAFGVVDYKLGQLTKAIQGD